MLKVFISDLHLGAGDALDDFVFLGSQLLEQKSRKFLSQPRQRMHQLFDQFLQHVIQLGEKFSTTPELILLGDIFDLLQVEPAEKLFLKPEKLKKIQRAHKPFFEALRSFTRSGAKVTYVVGNHDHELLHPELFNALLELLPELNASNDHTPLTCYGDAEAGIYAEHGNQFDPFNVFKNFSDPAEIPFGSLFTMRVVNLYEAQCPLLDNIQGTRETAWFFIYHLPYFLLRPLAHHLRQLWKTIPLYPQNPFVHLLYALQQNGILPEDKELNDLLLELLTITYQELLDYALKRIKREVPFARLLNLFHPIGIIKEMQHQQLLARIALLLERGKGKTVGKPPKTLTYFILGHTHRAELKRFGKKCYVNTGSWRPRAYPYRRRAFRLAQPLDYVVFYRLAKRTQLKVLNFLKLLPAAED